MAKISIRTFTASATRDLLQNKGFEPAERTKVAGVTRTWVDADGNKAWVGYSLLSKTGQSSIPGAASWGFNVLFEAGA